MRGCDVGGISSRQSTAYSKKEGLAGLPTMDGVHSIQSADGKGHLHCFPIQIGIGGRGDRDIADGIVVSSVEEALLPLQ